MTSHDSRDSQDSRDKFRLDRDDEDHDFVDQSKIDFDPDDGLYSGTAVEGNSEIAGPHMDTDSGELTDLGDAEQPAADDSAEQPSSDDEAAPAVGRHREASR